MTTAVHGDRVQVHYLCRLDSGRVVADSTSLGPMEFTIGERLFSEELEHAIVGMCTGESKTLPLAADRAFGRHRAELVRRVDRDFFRTDQLPELGTRVHVLSEGRDTEFTVTAFDGARVTLDANHPYVDQDVRFDLQLSEIY